LCQSTRRQKHFNIWASQARNDRRAVLERLFTGIFHLVKVVVIRHIEKLFIQRLWQSASCNQVASFRDRVHPDTEEEALCPAFVRNAPPHWIEKSPALRLKKTNVLLFFVQKLQLVAVWEYQYSIPASATVRWQFRKHAGCIRLRFCLLQQKKTVTRWC